MNCATLYAHVTRFHVDDDSIVKIAEVLISMVLAVRLTWAYQSSSPSKRIPKSNDVVRWNIFEAHQPTATHQKQPPRLIRTYSLGVGSNIHGAKHDTVRVRQAKRPLLDWVLVSVIADGKPVSFPKHGEVGLARYRLTWDLAVFKHDGVAFFVVAGNDAPRIGVHGHFAGIFVRLPAKRLNNDGRS